MINESEVILMNESENNSLVRLEKAKGDLYLIHFDVAKILEIVF